MAEPAPEHIDGLEILLSPARKDSDSVIPAPLDDMVHFPTFELFTGMHFVSLFMIGVCYGDHDDIHSVLFPLEMRAKVNREIRGILDLFTRSANCDLVPAVIGFLCFADPDFSTDTGAAVYGQHLTGVLHELQANTRRFISISDSVIAAQLESLIVKYADRNEMLMDQIARLELHDTVIIDARSTEPPIVSVADLLDFPAFYSFDGFQQIFLVDLPLPEQMDLCNGTTPFVARWQSYALKDLVKREVTDELLANNNRVIITWFIASIAGSLRLFIVSSESVHIVGEQSIQTEDAATIPELNRRGKCRVLALGVTRESFRFSHQIATARSASNSRAFGTQGDEVFDWFIKRKREQWARLEFSPLTLPGSESVQDNRFLGCLCDCVRFPSCFLRAQDERLELAVDVATGWIGASADEKAVAYAVQRYAGLAGKAASGTNAEERCLARVGACYSFTAFVQEFILALEAAEHKVPDLFEKAITSLFVRLPRERRELVRPVLDLVLGIAMDEPWMASRRNSILELFAVALGPNCLEQLGRPASDRVTHIAEWAKQQASLKFESPARDPITPSEAIRRIVRAAVAHQRRMAHAAELMSNPVELRFQPDFDGFVKQRMMSHIQIHP
jgi:hypothetical protein